MTRDKKELVLEMVEQIKNLSARFGDGELEWLLFKVSNTFEKTSSIPERELQTLMRESFSTGLSLIVFVATVVEYEDGPNRT